jgi:GTP cyclohydrolase II
MITRIPHQHSAHRAIADLRRGAPVLFCSNLGYAAIAKPAEQVTKDSLLDLAAETSSMPYLLITSQRARAIGLKPKDGVAACSILLPNQYEPEHILQLIGDLPLTMDVSTLTVLPEGEDSMANLVLMLMRSARLMPAALATHIPDTDPRKLSRWALDRGFIMVEENAIRSFEETAAELLREAARAKLPLKQAENAEVVIFQPKDGGTEHFVLMINSTDESQVPLVRIHSQCITGDILGSLKCDCGDQLQMAIKQMASSGKGLLIYLAQEGRDIGLVNKLRAYALQDTGLDTVDANHAIGFETDHRYYLPAAVMLRHLGHEKIRLLTNNLDKIEQIESCGITVTERIALTPMSNPHNENYLKTKKNRTGHITD